MMSAAEGRLPSAGNAGPANLSSANLRLYRGALARAVRCRIGIFATNRKVVESPRLSARRGAGPRRAHRRG
jgi:hypothetical protein